MMELAEFAAPALGRFFRLNDEAQRDEQCSFEGAGFSQLVSESRERRLGEANHFGAMVRIWGRVHR
jgi:hypothetical protein